MQFYRKTKRAGGFTLVELLVIMAIIAILAGVAIPGIVRLVGESRDEMSRSARTLYSMLRAARIYATTNRVDTAVVYRLDNAFQNPNPTLWNNVGTFEEVNAQFPGAVERIMDSQTGDFTRVGEAIAVVRRLKPEEVKQYRVSPDTFVPVTAEEGEFQTFPGEMALLFSVPTGTTWLSTNFVNYGTGGAIEQLHGLGMKSVTVDFLFRPNGGQFQEGPPSKDNVAYKFPAHVFQPSGALDVSADTERFTVYVAPRPDATIEDRFVNVGDPLAGHPEDPANVQVEEIVRSIPINLYRSTGRVEIDS